MNDDININADFLTFRNQIVEKFGEQYCEQAEMFFDRSMVQTQQGLFT